MDKIPEYAMIFLLGVVGILLIRLRDVEHNLECLRTFTVGLSKNFAELLEMLNEPPAEKDRK